MRSRDVDEVLDDADVEEDDPVLVLDLYDLSEGRGSGSSGKLGMTTTKMAQRSHVCHRAVRARRGRRRIAAGAVVAVPRSVPVPVSVHLSLSYVIASCRVCSGARG